MCTHIGWRPLFLSLYKDKEMCLHFQTTGSTPSCTEHAQSETQPNTTHAQTGRTTLGACWALLLPWM